MEALFKTGTEEIDIGAFRLKVDNVAMDWGILVGAIGLAWPGVTKMSAILPSSGMLNAVSSSVVLLARFSCRLVIISSRRQVGLAKVGCAL